MIKITIEQLTFGLFCRCKGRVIFRLGLAKDAASFVRTHLHRRPQEDYDMATEMLTEQMMPVSVKFTDSKGKAAKVDGAPTWATDNSDVLA